MDIVRIPRVIVVYFQELGEGTLYTRAFRQAGCLLHKCTVPDLPPRSFVDQILRRKSPFESYLKEMYEFVVENYLPGDSVVILDTYWYFDPENLLALKNRHTAIRHLAAALDRGFLHKSTGAMVHERIPIKCVFLRFSDEDLRWSGVDQLLSECVYSQTTQSSRH
ncbi:hypothetical protein BDV93DRAFT_610252 [Ceratobasidium sp. AG-I]|nr:hypothetical protein BDV93DRAFT_610252 [Ceratobasidium sp. AG-I]